MADAIYATLWESSAWSILANMADYRCMRRTWAGTASTAVQAPYMVCMGRSTYGQHNRTAYRTVFTVPRVRQ